MLAFPVSLEWKNSLETPKNKNNFERKSFMLIAPAEVLIHTASGSFVSNAVVETRGHLFSSAIVKLKMTPSPPPSVFIVKLVTEWYKIQLEASS